MGEKLTSQVRVIVLHIPAAGVVQDLQFLLVRLGNVGEILLVRAVHLFRVRTSLLIPQVIPVGCRKRDLQVLDLLRRDQAGQVLELVDVGAADMLDLTGTDDSLTGFVAGLGEGSNVRDVDTEDLRVRVLDFLEAIQTGEEGAPEHLRGQYGQQLPIIKRNLP